MLLSANMASEQGVIVAAIVIAPFIFTRFWCTPTHVQCAPTHVQSKPSSDFAL